MRGLCVLGAVLVGVEGAVTPDRVPRRAITPQSNATVARTAMLLKATKARKPHTMRDCSAPPSKGTASGARPRPSPPRLAPPRDWRRR